MIGDRYRVVRMLTDFEDSCYLEAEHTGLHEPVIVKLLSDRVPDPRLAARLLREARHAALVKSDHAARFIDAGRLGDGRPFVVMEHLVGEDLASLARRSSGELPISRAVDWVLEACSALRAAHAVGVLHKDLRTSSLFLTQRPTGDRVLKVMNFGTARLLDPTGQEEDPGLTVAGLATGAPDYMSPELLLQAKAVDKRADVWSLGVILYELLTGSRPFAGPAEDTVKRIMIDAPAPIHELRGDIPVALEAVIVRCLSKRAEERFANVSELAAALAPFASPAGRALASRMTEVFKTSLPSLVPTAEDGIEMPEPSFHRRVAGGLERAPPSAPLSVAPPRMPSNATVPSRPERRSRMISAMFAVTILLGVAALVVLRIRAMTASTASRVDPIAHDAKPVPEAAPTAGALPSAPMSPAAVAAPVAEPVTSAGPRRAKRRGAGPTSASAASSSLPAEDAAAVTSAPPRPKATDPWGWTR